LATGLDPLPRGGGAEGRPRWRTSYTRTRGPACPSPAPPSGPGRGVHALPGIIAAKRRVLCCVVCVFFTISDARIHRTQTVAEPSHPGLGPPQDAPHNLPPSSARFKRSRIPPICMIVRPPPGLGLRRFYGANADHCRKGSFGNTEHSTPLLICVDRSGSNLSLQRRRLPPPDLVGLCAA